MEYLGNALFYIGAFGWFIGYIWALWMAFKKSMPHGVACVLVAILLLFFLTTNLKQTWRPVLVLVCSATAFIGGMNLLKG